MHDGISKLCVFFVFFLNNVIHSVCSVNYHMRIYVVIIYVLDILVVCIINYIYSHS